MSVSLDPWQEEASHCTERALCVDLDGTLILGDVLLESLILLLKQRPYCLLLLPIWLLRGRAAFKAELAARVNVNAETLPYNRELICWLRAERDAGRHLWLCTAANDSVATRIACHLELFDGVLASDRLVNLAGNKKAACLVERFGVKGFDYCGNERRDIAIWKCSHGAVVVGRERLAREVERHVTVLHTFPPAATARTFFRALRPHQWAKNVLVAVPLVAAHRLDEPAVVIATLLATVAFCLCASSAYIVNDLLDLEADRAHPRKSLRPFASGDLSPLFGFVLAPLLFVVSAFIAVLLPFEYQATLATYYAITIAYSTKLKALVLFDVIALACLYTLRIIGGSAAIAMPQSHWLLWFSMFLFLSLAFVKRYAELDELHKQQRLSAAGRGYTVDDLPILQSLGSAAGYLSVVVLALYISSPDVYVLYDQPHVMWLVCVMMLFWISHVWVSTQRGKMHDDPVVFALRDRTSRVVGVLVVIAAMLAI